MEKCRVVLDLECIGILKKAHLDISGLSVIGGKNDTGKSTIGKSIMATIKALNMYKMNKKSNIKSMFDTIINLLFDGEISQKGYIRLSRDDKKLYSIDLQSHKCADFRLYSDKNIFFDCTFIQTPLMWDLYDFFLSIQTMQTEDYIYKGLNNDFDIKYPYILWDLYKKIVTPKNHKNEVANFANDINKIINGAFMKSNATYCFFSSYSNSEIPLINVASGIKYFGILQILLKNNYITPFGFFIFDEPENHLHPTWQVRFAEIIVKLVSKNIPIMINSHSPYMIESLQKFSKKYKINANFYLANDNEVKQINHSNEETLEQIFHYLNEPFAELEEDDLG